MKVKPHKNAKMIDDRYDVNKDEDIEILKKYFTKGLNGPVSTFSMKEKNKIIVLKHITTKFQIGKKYTEKEVNEILKFVHEDFVLLRRYLIGIWIYGSKKGWQVNIGSQPIFEPLQASEIRETSQKIN